MRWLFTLLSFVLSICYVNPSFATVRLVENTLDSGAGSLRNVIASAADGDTVLINVKGTITLESPINISGHGALTIIGPYPKHNTITSGGGCSGSLFQIDNSGPIRIRGLGFVGGNGNTRHLKIANCTEEISIDRCLFSGNDVTISGLDGAAAIIENARARFSNCSIIENSAVSGGGFSISSSSNVTVVNCTFSGNRANNRAGAINATGNANLNLYYSTFVENSATNAPEVLRFAGTTDIVMENIVVANNGTGRQIRAAGTANIASNGGNCIQLNFALEPTDMPAAFTGDYTSTAVLFNLGFRGEIKTDGFGLVYWPIIDGSSTLINRAVATTNTPSLDCRNAPRSLKGDGTLVWPDAGAAEYTHLRVTNTSGNSSVSNSFLWTLRADASIRKEQMHYIEFDIPGPVGDISFLSQGILSTEGYIIDGFSQSGSAIPGPHEIGTPGLTRAILPIDFVDGASNDNGIQFDAGSQNSIIQGVSIQSFDEYGIEINTTDISVLGCEIGIDNSGSGNGTDRAGLKISQGGTTIGGWEHANRNVISGNGFGAVDRANIKIENGDANTIYGNIIGGAPDGLGSILPITRALFGIRCETDDNHIGNGLINTKNIITDNEFGIFSDPGADDNFIQGNNIGIGWDGLTALGNTEAGICLSGADRTIIGGYDLAFGNIIAHNEIGVTLKTESTAALNNPIVGNLIYSNIQQGIDLENNGIVVPNDGLAFSSQQNYGIDYPVLSSSENCDGTQTTTNFMLSVTAGSDYRVEFFAVTSPDAANGEGEFFLAVNTVSVTSNPESFSFDHGTEYPPGTVITATVTHLASGNTSEFGVNATVTAPAADPTISYMNICNGDTAMPELGYEPGGTFRFVDPAPVDVIINSITGYITDAVEGTTYQVIHDLGGSCVNSDTTTFSVITVDEGFVFEDFCPGFDGIPGIINTPGGDFYLDPDLGDGAAIDINTGVLTGGLEGITYTVKYVAEGLMGCKDSTTVAVTVIGTDESFTMADFCAEVTSSPAVPVVGGGIFSFDPEPDDGATINAGTGAITGGIEGSTYTIKYVVGACAESSTLDVSTIITDESFVFEDFCPESIGSPSLVVVPGGFSFLEDPADGAVIDGSTGNITGGVEGTIYEVLHTVGACSDKDTAYPQVIEVAENFTFSDFCIIGDSSSIGPIIDLAADPDSVSFILLGALDGATINIETGIIYSPVEGTTYTVVDSTRNLGCWQSDTNFVTAIDVNEAFTFPTICAGDEGGPLLEVVLADTFYFEIDLMDGASIDPYSGELSGGIGGTTYNITRIAFVGACTDTGMATVYIGDPDASFVYDDFCPGIPSIAPTPAVSGGTFSFETPPLDGETMDEFGVIFDAIEDNFYSVVYTIFDDGCSDSDTVEVYVKVVNEGFTHEDFCWEAPSGDADPLEPDGFFTFGSPGPGDDATIDSETGIIEGATEGTMYEIVHTLITVEGCEQSDSLFITALGVDESFSFDDFCPDTESPTPTPATPGGTFEFSEPPADDATINSTTGVITGPTEGTTYSVVYSVETETGGCSESDTIEVSVISIDESFSFEDFCAESIGVPSDIITEGGTFAFAPPLDDGAEIDPATGIITSADPGAFYAIEYTIGECAETDTIYVNAFVSDVAEFTLEDHCANIEVAAEITGTLDGQFDFEPDPSDGTTIDIDDAIILNSSGGSYSVRYITDGSATSCADTLIKTVTIFSVPSITAINSDIDIYCPYTELGPIDAVSEDALKLYWYKSSIDGDIIDSSFNYTPTSLDLGNNVYYVQPYNSDGCYGEFESYTLQLSDTAGMRAISDFEICMGSPAYLLAYGGATYEWTTEIPLGNYSAANPTAFSLSEEAYVVTIKNEDNCQVVDTINVTFLPRNECAIDIYNAFSPNGDDRNDFWYIDNLINYVPNTVYIYNRWGDEVMEISNYDNIMSYWDGTDKNGNDLPPNTYFYVVVTEIPGQSQAGWVQIVR